jgi:hypothetical protein
MAIRTVTLADSISKLSVSNISIKDLDEIKDELLERDGCVVMPAPDFISNPKIQRDTFGSGSGAKWTFSYTLTYRLFYKPVQDERELKRIYPTMVARACAFVDAVVANDNLSGAEDIEFGGFGAFGVVEDPSGAMYFGCDVLINVQEFIN